MTLTILLSSQGGGSGLTMLMFPLILLVMYFFMIRPQQKKQKEAQSFKDSVKKGDKIVTIGGIHGRILEVRDNTLVIEAGNNIKLEVEKTAISMEMTRAAQ